MNTTMHVTRFTVAYWCVLIAALMPIACAWLAKSGSFGKPRHVAVCCRGSEHSVFLKP